MTEMVQRVAAAIAANVGVWPDYKEVARAAIIAMREPTPRMLQLADPWKVSRREVWRSLIDAALK